MKKWKIVVSLIIIIVVFSIAVVKLYPSKNKTTSTNVCFGENCFSVEVARDQKSREQGLMNRDSLDQDKGMIFVFDKEEPHQMWMKNTKISLDVIWMDKDGKVVDIKTLPPCTADPCPGYNAKSNSQFVLEINAGLAQKDNIKIGDKAVLKY